MRARLRSALRQLRPIARSETAVLLGLTALALVSHGPNMFQYPSFTGSDDEGIYAAQAWAVLREGLLSPYTYVYDHVPGGWILVAVWMALTGGPHEFGSATSTAVERSCCLLHVGSLLMVYRVARKLGCGVSTCTRSRVPGHDWLSVVDAGYRLLFDSSAGTLGGDRSSGLPPDWISIDQSTGQVVPLAVGSDQTTAYGYDAPRTYWRIALDQNWDGEGRATAYLTQAGFLRDEVVRTGGVRAVYTHDGAIASNDTSIVATAGALSALLTLDTGAANALYADQLVGGADYPSARRTGTPPTTCTPRSGAGLRPPCTPTHSPMSGTRTGQPELPNNQPSWRTRVEHAPIYRSCGRRASAPLLPWQRTASLTTAAAALTLCGIALGYQGFTSTTGTLPTSGSISASTRRNATTASAARDAAAPVPTIIAPTVDGGSRR